MNVNLRCQAYKQSLNGCTFRFVLSFSAQFRRPIQGIPEGSVDNPQEHTCCQQHLEEMRVPYQLRRTARGEKQTMIDAIAVVF